MAGSQSTTVLTISRQLGSGGSFIGQEVAKRLRFHYVDRDILHEAAKALHVDDADLEALEERVDSFWERLAPLFLLGVTGGPIMPPLPPNVSASTVFATESGIIRAVAARENVVIIGRGGAHVLTGHPGVISVFVHASEPVRVRRTVQAYGLSDPVAATQMVRRSDHQRADFNKALTHRDWTDASLYDLCVNTSSLALEEAADVVVQIVANRLAESERMKES